MHIGKDNIMWTTLGIIAGVLFAVFLLVKLILFGYRTIKYDGLDVNPETGSMSFFTVNPKTGERRYISDKHTQKQAIQKKAALKPIASGDSKVDAAIKDAQEMLRQLNTLGWEIKNNRVRQNALEIAEISQNIFIKLSKKPNLFSSLSRFFNYYLPTTIKLLTNYSYMEKQGIQGEHITSSMQKIDKTLGVLKEALKKQLDSLFKDTTLDLESDMDVLDQVLKKEGLTENDQDLKNFLDTKSPEEPHVLQLSHTNSSDEAPPKSETEDQKSGTS